MSTPRLDRLEWRKLVPETPLVPGIPALAPKEGWYARTTRGEGCLELSRLLGEDHWSIDAMWNRGVPIFVNGFGSRVSRPHEVSDEVAQLCDQAVSDRENLGHGRSVSPSAAIKLQEA